MRTTAPPLPALLTPHELAAALRVSEATAYRYLATGVVPAIRVGGVLRIRADDLERLVGLGEDGSAPTSCGSAPTTAASRAIPRGRRHPRGASS